MAAIRKKDSAKSRTNSNRALIQPFITKIRIRPILTRPSIENQQLTLQITSIRPKDLKYSNLSKYIWTTTMKAETRNNGIPRQIPSYNRQDSNQIRNWSKRRLPKRIPRTKGLPTHTQQVTPKDISTGEDAPIRGMSAISLYKCKARSRRPERQRGLSTEPVNGITLNESNTQIGLWEALLRSRV